MVTKRKGRLSAIERLIATLGKKKTRYLSWDKFQGKEEFRRKFNFQQATRNNNVRVLQ